MRWPFSQDRMLRLSPVKKRLSFVCTMRSANRFKLVIRFDLPIPKMLRKRHCAKWFSCMFLKTSQNCMKTSRYYNVGILHMTWRTHIPMICWLTIRSKNKHNTVLLASNSSVYNKTSLMRLVFLYYF